MKSFRFSKPRLFEYKPGQFMFITVKFNGERAKKHFTISSSPTEKEFIEFTKKLTGHRFSNALDALKVGDHIVIDAPYGRFTFEGEFKKIGMLSGGIGITPLRSICRYCTDKQLDTDIILLYGNNTERDIAFKEDLKKMQKSNRNLKVVLTISEASGGWEGYTGRIDAEMIEQEITDYQKRIFFTSGPPGMVRTMEEILKSLNVSSERIKTESFSGY